MDNSDPIPANLSFLTDKTDQEEQDAEAEMVIREIQSEFVEYLAYIDVAKAHMEELGLGGQKPNGTDQEVDLRAVDFFKEKYPDEFQAKRDQKKSGIRPISFSQNIAPNGDFFLTIDRLILEHGEVTTLGQAFPLVARNLSLTVTGFPDYRNCSGGETLSVENWEGISPSGNKKISLEVVHHVSKYNASKRWVEKVRFSPLNK